MVGGVDEVFALSEDERQIRLEEIRRVEERIDGYVVVPMLKYDYVARLSLEAGNTDFVADVTFWHGSRGMRRGFVRRIKPWGNADVGYQIRALSISDIISTVNYLIGLNKGSANFIYFRCLAPDMRRPLRCYVDIQLEILDEYKRQVLSGYLTRDMMDI